MKIMSHIRHAAMAAIAASMITLAPMAARADSYRSIETSSAQEIVAGMSDKLIRGLGNIATGWLEFPNQIVETYRASGPAVAATSGPVRGLGMVLVRTGAGFLETATFWLPLPGFYDSVLKPAYVWQDK